MYQKPSNPRFCHLDSLTEVSDPIDSFGQCCHLHNLSELPLKKHPHKNGNARNTDKFEPVWIWCLKKLLACVGHLRSHVDIKYDNFSKMWTNKRNVCKDNHVEVHELKTLASISGVNWVLGPVVPVYKNDIFCQVVAVLALAVSSIFWYTWKNIWTLSTPIRTLKNVNEGCLEVGDVCENDQITAKRNIFGSVCKFWTKLCFQVVTIYLCQSHEILFVSELIHMYSFDVSPRSKNNQYIGQKQSLAADSLSDIVTAQIDDGIGVSTQCGSISNQDENLDFRQAGLSTVLCGQKKKGLEIDSVGCERSNTLKYLVDESTNLIKNFERTDFEKADFNMIASNIFEGPSLSANSETLLGTTRDKTDKDNDSFQGEERNMSFLRLDSSSLPLGRALQLISVTLMPVQGIPWREFERETMRLASFAFYPEDAAISPNLLAGAGFVYIGNGATDLVRCFFCSVEKEFWRSTDNVEEVHMHLSPSCPIVSIRSMNNTVTNVSASADLSGYSSAVPVIDAGTAPSSATRLSQDTETAVACLDEVDFNTSSNEARDNSTVNFDASGRARVTDGDAVTPLGSNTQTSLGIAVTNAPMMPASFQDQGTEFVHTGSDGWLPSATLDFASQEDDNVGRESRANHPDHLTPNSNNISSSRTTSEHQGQEPQGQEPHRPLLINSQIYGIPSGDNAATGSSSVTTSNQPNTQNQTSVPVTYQTLGIFNERPKHPDFAVLARRIASFDGWPLDHALRIEDLARAGLFYTGYGDCCKCFFCGGGLRNWEKDDHALVEHARWFEKCGFLRQTHGSEFIQAVQDLKSNNGPITMGQVQARMRQKKQFLRNNSDSQRLTDDAAVKSLLESGYDQQEVVRVATSLRQAGELLSADLILRRLRTSSPLGGSESAGAEGSSDDRTEDEHLQRLKEQNFTLRNNLLCKICMDREVCTVFLPCGHLVCCNECALAMQDCPVCRRHIRATARALIR